MIAGASETPAYPVLNDDFSIKAGTDNTVVYKNFSEESALTANIATPQDWTPADKRTCLIMWHGGGWQDGNISQYAAAATYFSGKGAVVIRPFYRVSARFAGATPVDSAKDALSMAAWVLRHADRLGIDTNKIVCCGSSAGGHLAAVTVMSEGCDDEAPGIESFRPAAFLLNFPVLDLSIVPYAVNRINDEKRIAGVSPVKHIKNGLAPMVIYTGTADEIVQEGWARDFKTAYESFNNRCTIVLFPGQPHSFYNWEPYTGRINSMMYRVLKDLKIMK